MQAGFSIKVWLGKRKKCPLSCAGGFCGSAQNDSLRSHVNAFAVVPAGNWIPCHSRVGGNFAGMTKGGRGNEAGTVRRAPTSPIPVLVIRGAVPRRERLSRTAKAAGGSEALPIASRSTMLPCVLPGAHKKREEEAQHPFFPGNS